MPRPFALASVGVLAAAVSLAAGQTGPAPDLARHIGTLSAFDYSTRMNAARMIRRTPPAQAVPALVEAARAHPDQFVRYRALVLLTSFNASAAGDLMRSLLTDRNDRVREVAYRWLERNPDPALTLPLLAALETEQAEFVRPALVRAVAALPADELVRRTLVAEVGRGFDFFRSAVIEVLGERRAAYAADAIASVAELDGPLQDDALLALGRLADRRVSKIGAAIAKPSAEAASALGAARCLVDKACAPHVEAMVAAARAPGASPAAIRAAVAGLRSVADADASARAALIDLATNATGRLRSEVAIAISAVALRHPPELIAWVSELSEEQRTAVVDLLREGFESLEEDFAEEQFYAAARAAYWRAGEESTDRRVAATLIDRLEF